MTAETINYLLHCIEEAKNKDWADGIRFALVQILATTPQKPRKGHWIEGTCEFYCSECKYEPYNLTDYCPNCGADMRESKEK